MEYKIIIKASAQRDLDALPNREVEKIAARIFHLAENPKPFGVQKLHGVDGYRIRSGNYRILFEIDELEKHINIYRVKHRKEVYR